MLCFEFSVTAYKLDLIADTHFQQNVLNTWMQYLALFLICLVISLISRLSPCVNGGKLGGAWEQG